jgi:hypothetical protein
MAGACRCASFAGEASSELCYRVAVCSQEICRCTSPSVTLCLLLQPQKLLKHRLLVCA